MKKLIAIISIISLCYCCHQKKEKEQIEVPVSIAQKIANAHGFENWKNIAEIQFTFNVDRDSSHFERTWFWKPEQDLVVMKSKDKTVKYNRASIDSLNIKADQGFINDKFWLLVPFQLVWDEGTTISMPIKEKAPISNTEMNKIILTYSSDGGYTPGDAYDIYFDDNYLIKEWIFRKGNQKEASMITTFENYQEFNGIKIALEHKKQLENWSLNFTNVKVILK